MERYSRYEKQFAQQLRDAKEKDRIAPSITTRLQIQRLEKDLTVQQAAEKIGISYAALYMYEQGERVPRKDTLDSIAQFYNVSTAYLIGSDSVVAKYRDELSADESNIIAMYRASSPNIQRAVTAILRESSTASKKDANDSSNKFESKVVK